MKRFDFSKIKQFREASGLTVAELAIRAEIAPRQLWEIERRENDRSLTTGMLTRIATALGKEPGDFFVEAGGLGVEAHRQAYRDDAEDRGR